jgi:dCTP deaminase
MYRILGQIARIQKMICNLNNALIAPRTSTGGHSSRCWELEIVAAEFVSAGSFCKILSYPRDLLTIYVGKSTCARCGIARVRDAIRAGVGGIRNTGNLQTTLLPAKVKANEGLCQIQFFRSDAFCAASEPSRKGKCQKQQEIVFQKTRCFLGDLLD